ncbi:hypothetical protein J7J26_00135 [Candidatus Micrarchaeota archaeon]|nr:hypothetical protein [Candidatus Micrarchaeota archaeon]
MEEMKKLVAVLMIFVVTAMMVVYLNQSYYSLRNHGSYKYNALSDDCGHNCSCANGIPCSCSYQDGECKCTECRGRVIYY